MAVPRLILYVALAMALVGGAAAAAPAAAELRAVQFALAQVRRYDPGPPDGVAGPRTGAALAAYAGSRPLEDAFWTVAAHLKWQVWWRTAWTPEAEAAVRAGLARVSTSGRVPGFRDRRLFAVDGSQAACVRVGGRWLHFALVPQVQVGSRGTVRTVLATPGPAPIPAATADLWCALGYVPAADVGLK